MNKLQYKMLEYPGLTGSVVAGLFGLLVKALASYGLNLTSELAILDGLQNNSRLNWRQKENDMNTQYDELALAVSQNAAHRAAWLEKMANQFPLTQRDQRRASSGGTIVDEVVIIADSPLVMSDSSLHNSTILSSIDGPAIVCNGRVTISNCDFRGNA